MRQPQDVRPLSNQNSETIGVAHFFYFKFLPAIMIDTESMHVPIFWDSELYCGKLLGSGSFCDVLAVTDIVLCSDEDSHDDGGNGNYFGPPPLRPRSKDEDESGNPEKQELQERLRQRLGEKFAVARARPHPSRQEIAQLAIYGKPTGPPKEIEKSDEEPAPKLAVKKVRLYGDDEDDDKGGRRHQKRLERVASAQRDFQNELEILLEITSSRNSHGPCYHPNIIELHGIGFARTDASPIHNNPLYPQPSCLLLSLMRTTLSKRLVAWRHEYHSVSSSLYQALSLDVPNRRSQWVERVIIASKIAHALHHLHAHQIVYRDVKPENVGFASVHDDGNHNDVPQLFDFGLAKKVKTLEQEAGQGGIFRLTPGTGTLVYMAIEVGQGKPYGYSADVWSLGVLIHEILSLKVPFAGITPSHFREKVWNSNEGHGLDRLLVIDKSWPIAIQELLPRMWHVDPAQRPDVEFVVSTLDDMLRGSDRILFPKSLVNRGG